VDARPAGKKLVCVVVDGLGPALLDRAIALGHAPTIAGLRAAATHDAVAVSVFPSLTPVCLTALATGAHPARSGIPGMTWFHREEGRMVEYGSSFAATVAEGTRQMVDDVLVNLNLVHLSPRVHTIWEDLEDAGFETAAVNTFVYRGRVRHPIARPVARRLARRMGIVDAVYAPRRFFFGELFASDRTGAPRNFGTGIDRHAGGVARWLVTRDGFDFLFLYLYETDAAQHRGGDAMAAVERADSGVALMVDAAGGLDAFLDRYAVVLVADHGQSAVERIADAAAPFDDLRVFRSSRRASADRCDVAVAASNRVSMIYRLPAARATVAELAARAAAAPAADVVLRRDGDGYVAARAGGELRFRRGGATVDERGNAWTIAGDADLLPEEDYPCALERIEGLLASPRAGDVVVSATAGWEFADAGGQHHAGGGSHGSLGAEDSFAPLVLAGFDGTADVPARASIVDVAPLARRHFGLPVAPAPAAVPVGRVH
jgi:hypothetical protein